MNTLTGYFTPVLLMSTLLTGLALLLLPQQAQGVELVRVCSRPLKQDQCRSFFQSTKTHVRVIITEDLRPTKLTVEGPFHVVAYRDGELHELKRLFSAEEGKTVSVKYKKKTGMYVVTKGNKKVTTPYPVRVIPKNMEDAVEVRNYERRPVWDDSINDNLFFGYAEVTYSEQDDATYVVNGVPIEQYVSGIGEVLNNAKREYQKTMLTAARTYALYKTKNPRGDVYHLDATDGSQIYLGANFTRRAPNIVKAQKATKGMVVKYRGKIIVAPYFSHSDGRTRSWGEVWSGGNLYPWSKSVDDPCCTHLSLYGHGVGLSGEGARYFARQKGWGYKKIIKYYYKGVKVKQY